MEYFILMLICKSSLLTWIWEARFGGHTLYCGLLGNKLEWTVFLQIVGNDKQTQQCRLFTSLHFFISHVQPGKARRSMQTNPRSYSQLIHAMSHTQA